MSNPWEEFGVERKVLDILRELPYEETHSFGRHFLTSYQIAILLDQAHPGLMEDLGHTTLGGAGVDVSTSFTQYIGNRLSAASQNDGSHIEGAFLGMEKIKDFEFKSDTRGLLNSSLTGTGRKLSMYRYIDEP